MSSQKTPPSDNGLLLETRGLVKHYITRRGMFDREGQVVRAVDGVSFSIRRGETLGLVGESGSGKTTTGKLILRLEEPTSGQVLFEGRDFLAMPKAELRRTRRRMQLIFQDPYGSLNPRMRVGSIVSEGLKIHHLASGQAELRDKVAEILAMVGLRTEDAARYPHEFSGGQRQRIGIARALAVRPELVVADEPISALDVSIQAQILNLLMDLRETFGLTYLFISHDLMVVRHISDRIAVMYAGRIVELAGAEELFNNPLHPYTRVLLAAIPVPDPEKKARRTKIPAETLSDERGPCAFIQRCPAVTDRCRREEPALREVAPEHWVGCLGA
ncbi:MAG: oligopeptide/dipeptide ABC transporter ATP-binding protein [Pseudomonadota bacterium]